MYEKLLMEAQQLGIDTYEKPMSFRIKGLYSNNVIWINKNISSSTEKACILAEELGHYHTSTGDILDQSHIVNRKQELRARSWAYEKLVPLPEIIQAQKAGIRNRHQFSEYLGVSEAFLENALIRYKEKHGLFVAFDNYIIYFEPLGVLELFECW